MECTAGWSGVTYINLQQSNLTRQQYNRLLTSRAFWNHIVAEHALVFQTDSLMRKRVPEHFFAYDYVGAPWKHAASSAQPKLRVGNGGFSLRRVSAMRDASGTTDGELNEDVWFAERVQRVCDEKSARAFSVEHLGHNDPVGFHQAHKWQPPAATAALVESAAGWG